MPPRIKKSYSVSDEAQLEAMASTPRLEVLYGFIAIEGGTIRDVAKHMRRKPASLYRHVQILTDTGLLVEAGTKQDGRYQSSVYMPIAKRIRLPDVQKQPKFREPCRAVIRAQCRNCELEMSRSIDSPDAVFWGPTRNYLIVNGVKLVSKDQLREINKLLDRVVVILQEPSSKQKRTPIGITLATRPVERI